MRNKTIRVFFCIIGAICILYGGSVRLLASVNRQQIIQTQETAAAEESGSTEVSPESLPGTLTAPGEDTADSPETEVSQKEDTSEIIRNEKSGQFPSRRHPSGGRHGRRRRV